MSEIPDNLDTDELERLHYHVDNIIHTRTNLLLVAETLLLAALAQMWQQNELFVLILFCAFGVAISYIFGNATITLYERSRKLAAWRIAKSATYKAYFHCLDTKPKQTERLARLIPWLFGFLWLLLFILVLVSNIELAITR